MRLTRAIERKLELIRKCGKLGKGDWHARREPRDCGITVHPAIGCDLGCVYCYIADMGFPTDKVEPYPLSGEELKCALMHNPHVIPTKYGTYVAVGSVTEPFHPLSLNRTLEYLKALDELRNHVQISYKMIMPERKLSEFVNSIREISVLISISSVKKWKELEPRLPSPEQRLEMGSKIKKGGKRVALFLRPLIPQITDKEAREILELSLSYGIDEIVIGGMRVTERIIRNLSKLVPISELLRRATSEVRGKKQVPLRTRDLKERIIAQANALGFEVYYTACDANARHHNEVCWDSCKYNPSLCDLLPEIDENDLKEGAKLLGGRVYNVKLLRPYLMVIEGDLPKSFGWLVQMAYRRQVIVKSGGKIWKYL